MTQIRIFVVGLTFFTSLGWLGLDGAHAFSKKKPSGESTAAQTPQTAQSPQQDSSDSVWVEAPDRSKSCEDGSGISIDKAGQTLESAGIHVLEKSKGSDGRMRAAVCGIETGKLNAFRIPKKDMAKAIALGFKPQTDR